jgi:hypothetical protein
LRGVNAVLLNQWTVDAAKNHAAAVEIVSKGVFAGESLGAACAAVSFVLSLLALLVPKHLKWCRKKCSPAGRSAPRVLLWLPTK